MEIFKKKANIFTLYNTHDQNWVGQQDLTISGYI